jgi:O-antigen/teichoic acid export membrane protein
MMNFKLSNYLKDSALKSVLKNTTTILSGNILANIFGLLSFSLFTKSQGAVLFGNYVLFLSFIEIIDRIFNFQTWQAFIKFAHDFSVKNQKNNILMLLKYSFFVDFFSLIFATTVSVLLSPFVLKFYNISDSYLNLLILLSLTILFRTAEITTGVLRYYDRFNIQSRIAVYSASTKLGLFILIAFLCPKFEYFIYATILSQLITTILKIYFTRTVLREDNVSFKDIYVIKIDYDLIRELKILSFVIYNNFDVTIRMVSRQLDTILVGKFFGSELVGVYKVVKEISNLITKLTDPIYQTLYPEFAKMLSNKKYGEAKSIAFKISYISALFGILFYILFIIFGKWSIGIAFGEEFIKAYIPTLIYFIAIFIAIITMTLYPLQHAFGFAKSAFKNQLFSTLLYLPFLFIFTYHFSLTGAAISYILYYIIITIFTIKSIKIGFNNVS